MKLKAIIYSGMFAFIFFYAFNAFAATEILFYTYDDHNQLTNVQYSDGTTVDYTFDLLGNRLTKTTSLGGGPPNNPPTIPADLLPLDNAVDVNCNYILEWTPSTDPNNNDTVIYHIYFGQSENPPLVSISKEPTYDPGPLFANTTYYWQIKTIDNHNEISQTPVMSFTTTNDPPETPQISSPKDESIIVAQTTEFIWTGDDPNIGDTVAYDIYLGTSELSLILVENNWQNNTYSTALLNPHTTYYWQIVARDNHGAETQGPVWTVNTLSSEPAILNYVTYDTDTTLTKLGGPYMVNGVLTINPGVTLTIEPGTIIKMGPYTSIEVHGTLNAQGIENDKIIITSEKNDAYGGDCNKDGNTTRPFPGDWLWIFFHDTSQNSLLDHVIVEYGGFDPDPSVYISGNAGLDIQNSIFINNYSCDIYSLNNGTATFSENSFNSDVFLSSQNLSNFSSSNSMGDSAFINITGGTITEDTTLYGKFKYNILENFSVQGTDGADNLTTLTIEAGAQLYFAQYSSLMIARTAPGSLVINGTESNPVILTCSLTDPFEGGWFIYFYPNSQNCLINYTIFELVNIEIFDSASVDFLNSDFGNLYGPDLISHSNNVTYSGNTFNTSIQINAQDLSNFLPSNSLSNIAFICIEGNTISEDTTLSGNFQYKILNSVTVKGTDGPDNLTTLTIEAGAKLLFSDYNYAGFNIADSITPGSLIVNGTQTNPVIFTSAQESGPQGEWSGIDFFQNSQNCLLDYAIVNHSMTGVRINFGAVVDIQNSIFENNSFYDLFSSSAGVTISANTFNSGIQMEPQCLSGFSSSNSLGDPAFFNIEAGTISNDTTLSEKYPYTIMGDITVKGTDGADNLTTLTIEAGTRLQFDYFSMAGLYVSDYSTPGSLVANGTQENPVIFTSGRENPLPGDWNNINFNSNSQNCLLNYARIEYGGAYYMGGIYIESNADLDIQNSTIINNAADGIYIYGGDITIFDSIIADNAGCGIYAESGSLDMINTTVRNNNSYGIYIFDGLASNITNSSIFGHSSYGLYVEDYGQIVVAVNNWWGHASGPYHYSTNSSGQGDSVSDNVDFTPWQTLEDDDSDGISDDWEILQFGNLTTADENSDYDGDGYSDLEEFRSNSDPKNDQDLPDQVGDIDKDSDTDGVDIFMMALEIGQAGCSITDPCNGDLNLDGSVDNIDLWIFCEYFGKSQ